MRTVLPCVVGQVSGPVGELAGLVGELEGKMTAAPPVDPLRAELHSKGLRLTPQRQMVLAAVAQTSHSTPEQILSVVQAQAAGVNVSTIYRTLALLEKLGLVRHTHLGHGASTFSLADDNPLVHLFCRECSRVLELPAGELQPLAARLLERDGFELDVGHMALTGRCPSCRAPKLPTLP